MSREPGDVEPYSSETNANTHAPWVSDNPLKVDLTGLRDYAKDMLNQQLDLGSRSAHLTHLYNMPIEAWQGMVLGEAAFLRAQMLGNAAELSAYLGNLGQTLFNIGSAAQTVADIYGSGDAMGAAELSDVLFAFGDKNVPRPDGLPKNVGQTYEEALMADDKKVAPAPETSAEWGKATTTVQSPYQTTQISQNVTTGQTREVVTMNVPGSGVSVVTTTIYDSKHEVVSTSSTRTSTSYDYNSNTQVKVVESGGSKTTTTTTYDGKGEVAHEDSKSTTTVDGKPESTGHREVTVDPATGVRTETTYNAKGEVTDQVVIGKETEGQLGVEKPISQQYDPTMNGSL
jgi:hypothetical protein